MSKSEEASWFADRSVRSGVLVGVGCWLMALGTLVVTWNSLPPELPWFYSLPWGEQQLIERNWLVVVVLMFGMIMVVNTFLARFMAKEEELLRRILVWGGVATELLMFLTLIRVVWVVL